MGYITEAVGLLNESGYEVVTDVREENMVGETAVVHPLHIGQLTVSYLIGERPSDKGIEIAEISRLKDLLQAHFDANELDELCFELDIPEMTDRTPLTGYENWRLCPGRKQTNNIHLS